MLPSLTRSLLPAALLLSLSAALSVAHAFKVEPLIIELDSIGVGARQSMRVQNNAAAPLTIEASAHRLALDAGGGESLTPADDDIVVFPPLAVVPPGSSQSFQVQYVGDPEIDASQAYRIALDQVPVDLGGSAGSQVGIVASINPLLNVVPPNTRPKLAVTRIEPEGDRWQLEIENRGDRFARFSETEWTISAGGRSETLPGIDVQRRADRNLILPGNTLTVLFTPPEGLSADGASIGIASD